MTSDSQPEKSSLILACGAGHTTWSQDCFGQDDTGPQSSSDKKGNDMNTSSVIVI